MGLDDALRHARQQADMRDSYQQREIERKHQERREADELAAEAVQHLLPLGCEAYYQLRRSPTGQYRGANGNRYTIASTHRCWKLTDTSGEHPQTGK